MSAAPPTGCPPGRRHRCPEAIGLILDQFNREFGEPSPGARVLAERVRELLAKREMAALLGGAGPHGVAVLRFRPDALGTEGFDCYVEELYVEPPHRGKGLGRALMEAAIDVARREGADEMHLGTSESDVAARRLYESLGFSNQDGGLGSAAELLLRAGVLRGAEAGAQQRSVLRLRRTNVELAVAKTTRPATMPMVPAPKARPPASAPPTRGRMAQQTAMMIAAIPTPSRTCTREQLPDDRRRESRRIVETRDACAVGRCGFTTLTNAE